MPDRQSHFRMHALLAAAIAVLMLGGTAASAVEPVGLVTELAGSGSAAQTPDAGVLEPLKELWPGAVISMLSGARAVIVHTPSGMVYDLSGPGRYRVLANGVEPIEGAKLSRRELPPELKTFQLKPLSTMQASVVMRGGPVRLDGPVGGVLDASELTFRVRGGLAVHRIEVVEGGQATVLPEVSASFNPSTTIALRPGTHYQVVVKGADARGRVTELSSRFWLIEADAAQRLKAARPSADASLTDFIVYAMALETAGATASARTAWTSVNERR